MSFLTSNVCRNIRLTCSLKLTRLRISSNDCVRRAVPCFIRIFWLRNSEMNGSWTGAIDEQLLKKRERHDVFVPFAVVAVFCFQCTDGVQDVSTTYSVECCVMWHWWDSTTRSSGSINAVFDRHMYQTISYQPFFWTVRRGRA